MNITDISQNDIKDAVAYKKHLTEGHSHTSGTVVRERACVTMDNIWNNSALCFNGLA